MNINEELKKELKEKLYKTLVRTAVLANAVGFMICFLLNGLKKPTILCGVCCFILLGFGIYGTKSKNIKVASTGIIFIATIIETPAALA